MTTVLYSRKCWGVQLWHFVDRRSSNTLHYNIIVIQFLWIKLSVCHYRHDCTNNMLTSWAYFRDPSTKSKHCENWTTQPMQHMVFNIMIIRVVHLPRIYTAFTVFSDPMLISVMQLYACCDNNVTLNKHTMALSMLHCSIPIIYIITHHWNVTSACYLLSC